MRSHPEVEQQGKTPFASAKARKEGQNGPLRRANTKGVRARKVRGRKNQRHERRQ